MTTVRVIATAGHGDHGKSTLCASAETRSRQR
jgi:translation elongation factor EF-Tu-like GTPase